MKNTAYKKLINQLGWTDHDVAIMFGYGGANPVLSMRASSRYREGNLKDTLVRILTSSPIKERIADLTAVEVRRESANDKRIARMPKKEHPPTPYTPANVADDDDDW